MFCRSKHKLAFFLKGCEKMSGGDVVCSGWLRKSPPEKKLRRYVSTVLIVFKCTQTAELLAQDSCKCTVCFLKTAGQSILHDRTHKGLAFALCVLKNVFKIRFSSFKYTRVCERGLWRFEQLWHYNCLCKTPFVSSSWYV